MLFENPNSRRGFGKLFVLKREPGDVLNQCLENSYLIWIMPPSFFFQNDIVQDKS